MKSAQRLFLPPDVLLSLQGWSFGSTVFGIHVFVVTTVCFVVNNALTFVNTVDFEIFMVINVLLVR